LGFEEDRNSFDIVVVAVELEELTKQLTELESDSHEHEMQIEVLLDWVTKRFKMDEWP
jgi:hypothetical protein